MCLCVCQSLEPELEAELGRIRDTAPKYGVWTKMKVTRSLHVFVAKRLGNFVSNCNFVSNHLFKNSCSH